MPDQQDQTAAQRPEIREGEDEAFRVYANNVGLQMSPFDFKLVFGEVKNADEHEFRVRDKVVVYVSPQHVKSLIALLIRNIKRYESSYGKLPSGTPDGEIQFEVLDKESEA